VSPEAFGRQLDWLSANGYHPIDYGDLRAYLKGWQDLPSRPVILTFDDGFADLYTNAYPLLRTHRMKAVAFIVSGFLDAPGRVTRAQVVEMNRDGVEIGSHTFDHADLTTVPPDRLQVELQGSKQMLEGLLGAPVPDFAYPAGRHDPAVEAAVAAAGYESASTTEPGTMHTATDRFAWTRVRVSGGEPPEAFAAALGPTDPVQVRQQVVPAPSPEPSSPR
jgi:peptidoglycan/xylan/chitin deacetylase (PgdA/CDA1 family)